MFSDLVPNPKAFLDARAVFIAAARCGISAADAIRPTGNNYLDIVDWLATQIIEDTQISDDYYQDAYETVELALEFDDAFSEAELVKHWQRNLNTQIRYLREYMREHFTETAARLKSPTLTRTVRWYHPVGRPPYSRPDVRFVCYFDGYTRRDKDDREKLVDASAVNRRMDHDRAALREGLANMGYAVHTANISWPLASAWGEDPEDRGENPQGGRWYTTPGSIQIHGWTKKT